MNSKTFRGVVAVATLGAVGAANAAAGDVDLSAITAAGTQIALVGAAVFALVIGIKVWKWIRQAAS